MAKCKCGCGGEVKEGKTFLPGHYQKWKKQQRKVTENPLISLNQEIKKKGMKTSSSGLTFCIIKGEIMVDNRDMKKEEPRNTEVPYNADREISLEEIVKAAKEGVPEPSVTLRPSMAPEIQDINNSVLTGDLASSKVPDRKTPGPGMKLWQKIFLIISVFMVTFGSAAYFMGVV